MATKATRFLQLTLPRQRFLQLCHRMYFGKIVQLSKQAGEPVLGPGCAAHYEKKIDCVDGGMRPPVPSGDFVLKKAHIEFFEEFDRLPDGTAMTVEVRFGLPSRLIWTETFA